MNSNVPPPPNGRWISPEEYGLLDNFEAFSYAVNWTEPFIIGIICFSLSFIIIVIALRKRTTAQIVLFFTSLMLGSISSYLNDLGRLYWRSFATQDYFDKNGFFAVVFFAFPILLAATITVINLVWTMANYAVVLKRHQLKAAYKEGKKDD